MIRVGVFLKREGEGGCRGRGLGTSGTSPSRTTPSSSSASSGPPEIIPRANGSRSEGLRTPPSCGHQGARMGHPRHPFLPPSCASDLTNLSGRHCAFTLLTRFVNIIFLSGPYAPHSALRGERGCQPHPTGRAFMERACDPIPVRLGRLHPAPLDPGPPPLLGRRQSLRSCTRRGTRWPSYTA